MDQKIQRDDVKKEKQAKKTLAASNAKHPNVDEGVTVRIKVPEVDRAKTDARSILAVVLSKTEDGFYKLGTKTGILKQLYCCAARADTGLGLVGQRITDTFVC